MILCLLGVALAQEPAPTEAPVGAEASEEEAADEAAEQAADEAAEQAAEQAEVDPRDAELFGSPAVDSRDDDIFGASSTEGGTGELGGPLLTDREISQRLALRDDRLTIGGQAWLRLDSRVSSGDAIEDVDLSSPSFMDLFTDARPNDRLRLYARGRLRHDMTVKDGDVDDFGNELQPSTVALDQLWMNFDIGRKVFVTAGRQRIKWGAGRLWNPTDFLAPSALDSLAVFDERLGVGLVKVDIPLQATNTNVYVLAALDGARALDEVGGALRVEQLIGPAELALSGSLRKDQPQQLGGQLTFPLWLFDVKGEVAMLHGVTTPSWEGSFDLASFTVPTEVDRSEDWIPQATGGLELGLRYNDRDTLYLGAEYFFNDLGQQDESLYPWLIANGQFTPFYLGRHYVAAYLLLPGPGNLDDHTFSLTGITNLSDGSVVGRVDYSARLLSELSFNTYAQVHGGTEGGEFAFALELPVIPGVLDDGLSITRPLVDLGLGMQLRF